MAGKRSGWVEGAVSSARVRVGRRARAEEIQREAKRGMFAKWVEVRRAGRLEAGVRVVQLITHHIFDIFQL